MASEVAEVLAQLLENRSRFQLHLFASCCTSCGTAFLTGLPLRPSAVIEQRDRPSFLGHHIIVSPSADFMKSLELRVDPARFVRIHRSRIVCLPHILELRSMENREYVIKLSDGSQHRCSRTYATRIDSWLRDNR